jgi:predicted DCC family thiol-disulfide oxidoreductase YuxK
MKDEAALRVLYNARCPICRAEIGHYASLAATQALPLRFDDLNGPDITFWGVSPDTAARRLHVLHEGRVVAGIEAFRLIWAELPRYRWLARVTGWPGIRQATAVFYDRVAAPLLYGAHRRRTAQADKPVPPGSTRH